MAVSLAPLDRAVGMITGWWILLVLLLSSLVMNACQVLALYGSILLGVIDPVQRLSYSQSVANTWWQIFCFLCELWSGMDYRWTGDKVHDSDCAILLGNHERGIDFVNGIITSSRAADVGCGKMITLMKKSLKYLPIVGFTHSLQGSLFLARDWQTDEMAFKRKLEAVEQRQFPRPFWIGIYPEGTRITAEKKKKSHAFALAHPEKQLPLLQHVLLPRTKGFCYLLQQLPTALDCIYDCTLAYSTTAAVGSKKPSAAALYITDPLLHGRFSCDSVHIHIQRIAAADLPDRNDEAAVAAWLLARFVLKDKQLQYFAEHQRFEGVAVAYNNEQQLHNKYRLAFAGWSSVVVACLWLLSHSMPLLVLSMAAQLLALHRSFQAKRQSAYGSEEGTASATTTATSNGVTIKNGSAH